MTDEIDIEDALGIAYFMVETGQAPPPWRWVDGMIEEARANAMEGLF